MTKVDFSKVKRRANQIGYLLTRPIQQWQHLRSISAALRAGVAIDNKSGWRNLGIYLRDDLNPEQRASVIRSHFDWLLHRAPPELRGRHWSEGFVLWQRDVDATCYSMWVGPASFSSMEGELQISLVADEFRLFTLTCLILPGQTMGIDQGQILFIGGMQGRYAGRDRTRKAARDLGEIAPAALVVVAARVLASALGLDGVGAINAERQVSKWYSGERQLFDYDGHWNAVGADQLQNGLFLLHGLNAQRNLEHLSSSHRARARRKAKFKAEIARQILERLIGFQNIPEAPSGVRRPDSSTANSYTFPEPPVSMTIRGPVSQRSAVKKGRRWLAHILSLV